MFIQIDEIYVTTSFPPNSEPISCHRNAFFTWQAARWRLPHKPLDCQGNLSRRGQPPSSQW